LAPTQQQLEAANAGTETNKTDKHTNTIKYFFTIFLLFLFIF